MEQPVVPIDALRQLRKLLDSIPRTSEKRDCKQVKAARPTVADSPASRVKGVGARNKSGR